MKSSDKKLVEEKFQQLKYVRVWFSKLKFLCVLCVLCGLAFPAYSIDREAFTFTKYDLDVRIEPEQQRLAVRGRITLRNDSDAPQKNISLQISSSLDWRSIRLDGKPVQFLSQPYTSDIDHTGALSEAIVNLPQPVPPRGVIELEVGYEGVIPLDTTRLTRIGVPEDQAKHTDWDQISPSFTTVRGIGYVIWYPVATEAASLSDANSVFDAVDIWKRKEANVLFNLQASVSTNDGSTPAEILLNATGCASLAGDMSRARENAIRCAVPNAGVIVPTLVMAPYKIADNAAVAVHYLEGGESAAQLSAQAFAKVVPFVTDWFGSPNEKAEVLQLPGATDAPFESGSFLLTPLQNIDSKLAQIVAVHQLTHAAFYSARPWIYEGVAHFAQAAYREQQDGRQAALDLLALHLSAITDAEKAAAQTHNANAVSENSLINTDFAEFYRSKAAYVWWMLRDIVGEAALKKALKTYQPDHDKGPVYMQHLIEAQSHRDLEWFFDDWVYRDRGLPDFRIASIYPRKLLKGGYLVTVTVEDLGDAGAEVPVMVRTEQGDVSKRLEVHGKSKASIRIEVVSKPQEVIVNDGSVPESDTTNNTLKVESIAPN